MMTNDGSSLDFNEGGGSGGGGSGPSGGVGKSSGGGSSGSANQPLDTENGQVFPPRSAIWDLLSGHRIWGGYGNNPLLNNKFEVSASGYIIGPAPTNLIITGNVSNSPLVSAKQLINLKKFIKGRYLAYVGRKLMGTEKLLYFGKAKESLSYRYTTAQLESLEARVIRGLDNIPNNAIALGVEQLVIELNGGIEAGQLANKINATVKEIYINEARGWLDANIPNWESTLKFK